MNTLPPRRRCATDAKTKTTLCKCRLFGKMLREKFQFSMLQFAANKGFGALFPAARIYTTWACQISIGTFATLILSSPLTAANIFLVCIVCISARLATVSYLTNCDTPEASCRGDDVDEKYTYFFTAQPERNGCNKERERERKSAINNYRFVCKLRILFCWLFPPIVHEYVCFSCFTAATAAAKRMNFI